MTPQPTLMRTIPRRCTLPADCLRARKRKFEAEFGAVVNGTANKHDLHPTAQQQERVPTPSAHDARAAAHAVPREHDALVPPLDREHDLAVVSSVNQERALAPARAVAHWGPLRNLCAVHCSDTDGQQLVAKWNRWEFGESTPTAWSTRYWSMTENIHAHLNLITTAIFV
ncbi:hypothetical protein DFH09DRAFT_1338119 [Mycena vulgaris]|nr:hypothetical protein DFH09DRAFT_1338119 [Mycena vulgaris]